MRISDWSSVVCSSDLSDAIFAPDEIWVRIDCTAHRLLTDAARMREREPGVTHHDVMRNPVIHCIQRGWTAVGGVRCSINRTIGYFKHCNSPQAATASDVAVLFSISFRRSSPCRETDGRSEEHTSELQSLMRISYAVFCLKKKKINKQII